MSYSEEVVLIKGDLIRQVSLYINKMVCIIIIYLDILSVYFIIGWIIDYCRW